MDDMTVPGSPLPTSHVGSVDVPLGTAEWLNPSTARERFGFDETGFAVNLDGLWEGKSTGQAWLGETADVTSSALGYVDDRHISVVCGSRGGKGTSIIVPNLCLWPGSCFVLDPKGENATITARRRGAGSPYTYGLHQSVYVLDPFGDVEVDDAFRGHYNPLDAIDPSSETAVDDAARLAGALVITDGQGDEFFAEAAVTLIRGTILHVLTDPDFDGIRNLITVWRLLTQGDWLTAQVLRKIGREKIPPAFDLLWQGMKRNPSFNGLVSGVGEEMLTIADRTRDGIRKSATRHLEFIAGAPMQRILAKSDFSLASLKTDPKGISIFVTLPQRYMKTHFRWLRVMTDLALGEMERVKSKPATGHSTLFVLDEFAGLKRMEPIEHAAAQAAGAGVKFMFIVQNLGQLKEVYKENWETFLGSGLRIFADLEDDFTKSYLSRQLGEREVYRTSGSGSRAQTRGKTTTTGQSSSSTFTTGRSKADGTVSGTSYSATEGTSDTKTDGGSETDQSGYSTGSSFGKSGSFTRGEGWGSGGSQSNYSTTDGWSHTDSSGANWSNSKGANWSEAVGRSSSETHGTNSSRSKTYTTSDSNADTTGRSTSDADSMSEADTQGWSEAVHKRALLTPDEIGRFLARVRDETHPSFPGLMAALVPGEHPLLIRRTNYFASARFAGFYDPHPEHEAPPTLAELAERVKMHSGAESGFQRKESESAPRTPSDIRSGDTSFAIFAIGAALTALYIIYSLFSFLWHLVF